jgi:hypothetical protein
MSVITEYKLRRLFRDRGFRVVQVRHRRHWVARVERESGGPRFRVTVSQSPSDHRFLMNFALSLRRAERATSKGERS